MSDDISGKLRHAFKAAAKTHIYALLKSPEGRTSYAQIEEKAAQQRSELTLRYGAEYDARVDAERHRLLSLAAAHQFDHPTPIGFQSNRPDMIERTAHRNVQRAHQANLEQIDRREAQQVAALLEHCKSAPHIARLFQDMASDITRQREGQIRARAQAAHERNPDNPSRPAGPSRSRE